MAVRAANRVVYSEAYTPGSLNEALSTVLSDLEIGIRMLPSYAFPAKVTDTTASTAQKFVNAMSEFATVEGLNNNMHLRAYVKSCWSVVPAIQDAFVSNKIWGNPIFLVHILSIHSVNLDYCSYAIEQIGTKRQRIYRCKVLQCGETRISNDTWSSLLYFERHYMVQHKAEGLSIRKCLSFFFIALLFMFSKCRILAR
jgi:hypothetical protein